MEAAQQKIRNHYGLVFPNDFFEFWDFAQWLNPEDPLNALEADLEINLVGPFEVLAGRFDEQQPQLPFILHWRFYRDPPEFFTVLAGQVDGLHWGYYFDDPSMLPGCVCRYYQNDAYQLENSGSTLFDAVETHLAKQLEGIQADIEDGVEDLEDWQEQLDQLSELSAKLQQFQAGRTITNSVPARVITAPTWDEMGIVVSPELYRPLVKHTKAEKLIEAREALETGFPGTALKFGKDLWSLHSEEWEPHAIALLDAAYAALNRPLLQQVLQNHLQHRDPALAWIDILASWYL
ncbi:MAG TPA: ADP-ribosylation family protein [Allocoleopsis sp.]